MKRSYSKFEARLDAVGLKDQLEHLAMKAHVTLVELYAGPNRAPSISAARRAVYTWLSKSGKGLNEIARLFDRAPNGIKKMLDRAKAEA